jgi:RimJ/RimL family protein N-acetyltransferase
VTEEISNSTRYPHRAGVEIEPITPEVLARLRLGWSNKYDHDDLREIVRANPGISQWVPSSGEYLIAGPWRHRSEIAQVLDLSGSASAVELLRAFVDAGRRAGKRLVIASEHVESRRRVFYEVAGYDLVEEIIIYELSSMRFTTPPPITLRFERVSIADHDRLLETMAVDHAAFPWLWRNSLEEFENYGESLGVEIYLGRDEQGQPVAYIGITRFRDWGHLDRIAVSPEYQGKGYGLQALDWAVLLLGQSGARRVGLSTQARNTRSRQLYERYGFRRVPSQDYSLYGYWLDQSEQEPPSSM